jgi:hypothetical protein
VVLPCSTPSTTAETTVPDGALSPFTVTEPIKICGGTAWAKATAGTINTIAITASKAKTLALVIDCSFNYILMIRRGRLFMETASLEFLLFCL